MIDTATKNRAALSRHIATDLAVVLGGVHRVSDGSEFGFPGHAFVEFEGDYNPGMALQLEATENGSIVYCIRTTPPMKGVRRNANPSLGVPVALGRNGRQSSDTIEGKWRVYRNAHNGRWLQVDRAEGYVMYDIMDDVTRDVTEIRQQARLDGLAVQKLATLMKAIFPADASFDMRPATISPNSVARAILGQCATPIVRQEDTLWLVMCYRARGDAVAMLYQDEDGTHPAAGASPVTFHDLSDQGIITAAPAVRTEIDKALLAARREMQAGSGNDDAEAEDDGPTP